MNETQQFFDALNKKERLFAKQIRELKEGNASLKNEIESLRSRVKFLEERLNEAEPSGADSDDLSLIEAFNSFYLEDGCRVGAKNRTYNCFNRAGYKTIEQFEGKSIFDLLEVRNAGSLVCAVMIVVLEHFGVQVSIPGMNDMSAGKISQKPSVRQKSTCNATIRKVLEELPMIRENCVFMK